MIHGGGQRYVAGIKDLALAQQHVTLFEIESGGADETAFGNGFQRRDEGTIALGMLLNENGIRPFWHRSAGEDAHSFPIAEAIREALASGTSPTICSLVGRSRILSAFTA